MCSFLFISSFLCKTYVIRKERLKRISLAKGGQGNGPALPNPSLGHLCTYVERIVLDRIVYYFIQYCCFPWIFVVISRIEVPTLSLIAVAPVRSLSYRTYLNFIFWRETIKCTNFFDIFLLFLYAPSVSFFS